MRTVTLTDEHFRLPGQDLNYWQKPLKKAVFWMPGGQMVVSSIRN